MTKCVWFAAFLGTMLAAQPRFEVASVRQNKSEDFRRNSLKTLPGGKLSCQNMPLLFLISIAYEVPFQSSRLAGGPDWIRSDRFDIEATPPEGAIPPQASARQRDAILHRMLQGLLEDRFHLVMRRETKELPVYAVVLASKRGPKLDKSGMEEKDCPMEESDAKKVGCHSFRGGQGRGLHSDAATIEDAATFVSNWTDRPVVDQTGIKTLFRFDTSGWVPMQPMPGTNASPEGLDDPLRPSIFGVFTQMGLKLEPRRAPVEMFMIEKIEHPAAN